MIVDPLPDMPVALVQLDTERALVISDFHAGIETALRYDGLEIDSRATARRDAVISLLDDTDADRVIFLGDLAHWIGKPIGNELTELCELLAVVTDRVPALLVKGNHDGKIEGSVEIPVAPAEGIVIDNVGFIHGHSIPKPEVVQADVVCVGHEHVTVRIEDSVGGRHVARGWLRGHLDPDGFPHVDPTTIHGEIIVFPAFNELVGGTWVNVPGQEFLSPFLPAGLAQGEVYLLDGTRLGRYQEI